MASNTLTPSQSVRPRVVAAAPGITGPSGSGHEKDAPRRMVKIRLQLLGEDSLMKTEQLWLPMAAPKSARKARITHSDEDLGLFLVQRFNAITRRDKKELAKALIQIDRALGTPRRPADVNREAADLITARINQD